MTKTEKIPLSEAFPWATMRRQAKANLAPPTTSFQGKAILLVGATGAILSDASRIIASLKVSTLIFAVRNVVKGNELADELRQKHAGGQDSKLTIQVLEVNLLSFDSVRAFAAVINQFQTRIDAVVMGSAIMNTETRITADGWEETLQLIHLSSALLILLILPKMLRDGKERPIVLSSLTSSAIRSSAPMIALPDEADDSYLEKVSCVKDINMQRSYQYGIAKIIHACWIRELCDRHLSIRESGVYLYQVDPGACFTPLSSHIFVGRLLLWFIARPVEMCAQTVVNSCLPIQGSHGKLLIDYDVAPYPEFMNRPLGLELQQRAWTETRQILKGWTTPEMELFLNI